MGLARLPGSFTASLTLERGVIKVCKRACAFDPRAAGPTNAPMCCPQPGVAVVTPTGARNYLSHGERLPSQLATKTAVTPASTYGHSCGQQRYETGATWRQHGRTWPTLPSHHAVTAAATAVTAASAHTTTDTAINTCRHSTPRTPGCTPLNRTAVPALTPGVSASLAHKKSFTVRDFNCGHTAPVTTVTPHQHHGHTSNLLAAGSAWACLWGPCAVSNAQSAIARKKCGVYARNFHACCSSAGLVAIRHHAGCCKTALDLCSSLASIPCRVNFKMQFSRFLIKL